MSNDRERLRTTFNEDAELYDQARPGYPAALFDDIVALSGIPDGGRILEIGYGTGQATLPLAQRGYAIVGIDIGAGMAAVARRKLAGFPTVELHVGNFETFPLPVHSFDLVIAGTAFHWIDPTVGYSRLADVLRPGGAAALFWSQHVRVSGDDFGFFDEAQPLYERAFPDEPKGVRLEYSDAIPDSDADGLTASARFEPAMIRRYEWSIPYTRQSYLNVINTYSGHRALAPERRQQLYDGIANLIDTNYGGQIVKGYLTTLYLAKTFS